MEISRIRTCVSETWDYLQQQNTSGKLPEAFMPSPGRRKINSLLCNKKKCSFCKTAASL